MNCRPPTDLVGRVFLTKPDPRGIRHRARIIEVVKEYEDEVNVNKNPITRKFRIQMENGPGTEAFEDIMAYNDILNHVEREENTDGDTEWKFREILSHQYTPEGHLHSKSLQHFAILRRQKHCKKPQKPGLSHRI